MVIIGTLVKEGSRAFHQQPHTYWLCNLKKTKGLKGVRQQTNMDFPLPSNTPETLHDDQAIKYGSVFFSLYKIISSTPSNKEIDCIFVSCYFTGMRIWFPDDVAVSHDGSWQGRGCLNDRDGAQNGDLYGQVTCPGQLHA